MRVNHKNEAYSTIRKIVTQELAGYPTGDVIDALEKVADELKDIVYENALTTTTAGEILLTFYVDAHGQVVKREAPSAATDGANEANPSPIRQ